MSASWSQLVLSISILAWITPGMVRSMIKPDNLHGQLKRHGKIEAKIECECYREMFQKITRKARGSYKKEDFVVQQDSI